VSEGQSAIDFTLLDPAGRAYSLRELLETRPVFMVFGAFT
jgi:peroxiredoxin